MIADPDLIHYACIAKGTTVLAEFNSKDAALGATAAKCLENTPPYHATYTHTIRSTTYAFLIDDSFVYFSISDEKLEKLEVLVFLKSVGEAFGEVFKGERKLEKLSSHCFQGELNPVFRKLLSPALYGIQSPGWQRIGHGDILPYGSGPIRERVKPNVDKGSNDMKSRLIGEFKVDRRNMEENDEHEGNGIGMSHKFVHKNGGLYPTELMGHQKAKKVWKKQVWIVLSLDLIICLILFAVWLWVCRGFKCIES